MNSIDPTWIWFSAAAVFIIAALLVWVVVA